jgi:membrane-associated phospholipid phosphatase
MALSPLDRFTVVFAVLSSLAVLLRWPAGQGSPAALLLGGAALVVVALAAPRLRAGGGALLRFLGDFYALLLAVGIYTGIGVLNRAAGVLHDARVQSWERALFGTQPSMAWIRAQPYPWLSWPFHLAYLAYYFILAGAPLGLLLHGKRKEAGEAAALIMTSFYVCYTVFMFFPVAGPRYLFPLADNAATATAVSRFTQRLLNSAGAWGTAFPSSHVAAALTAALAAGRGWRALGALLLVMAVMLSLATVYCQFHYAVDATAGALVAAAVWALRGRILTGPPLKGVES